MIYGNAPIDLGHVDIKSKEMMYYLYLPVKMPNTNIRLPERLKEPLGVILATIKNEEDISNKYVYATVKRIYVHDSYSGNRPGWHVDGYGSNGDTNYIWYNINPTEFAVQNFNDIPDDDIESMKEMERQIIKSNITTYPNHHLLKLDESVVHRVNPIIQEGYRTFIKISVSNHRYNLEGNSHNYLFDYNWKMHSREDRRNCDNKDYALSDK